MTEYIADLTQLFIPASLVASHQTDTTFTWHIYLSGFLLRFASFGTRLAISYLPYQNHARQLGDMLVSGTVVRPEAALYQAVTGRIINQGRVIALDWMTAVFVTGKSPHRNSQYYPFGGQFVFESSARGGPGVVNIGRVLYNQIRRWTISPQAVVPVSNKRTYFIRVLVRSNVPVNIVNNRILVNVQIRVSSVPLNTQTVLNEIVIGPLVTDVQGYDHFNVGVVIIVFIIAAGGQQKEKDGK